MLAKPFFSFLTSSYGAIYVQNCELSGRHAPSPLNAMFDRFAPANDPHYAAVHFDAVLIRPGNSVFEVGLSGFAKGL